MPINNSTILRHRLCTEWQAWACIIAVTTLVSVFFFVGPSQIKSRKPGATQTEYCRVVYAYPIYPSDEHDVGPVRFVTVLRLQGKLAQEMGLTEYKKGQLLHVEYGVTPKGDPVIQRLRPADQIADTQR